MTPDEIRDRLANIIVEKLNSGVAMEEVRWESNLRDDSGNRLAGCCRICCRDRPRSSAHPLAQSMPRSLVTVRDAVNAISRGLPSSSQAA